MVNVDIVKLIGVLTTLTLVSATSSGFQQGLRAIIFYTYDDSFQGSEVFAQQLDNSTYDNLVSNKTLNNRRKTWNNAIELIALMDGRCDITMACQYKRYTTPRITTTRASTTPGSTTTTTPRSTTTTTRRSTTATTPRSTTTTASRVTYSTQTRFPTPTMNMNPPAFRTASSTGSTSSTGSVSSTASASSTGTVSSARFISNMGTTSTMFCNSCCNC